jgi:putative SOS response-associated peptidase YedK
VATKPAYKARRCLIPASGFSAWKRNANPKIPHFIHKQDDALMAFAGLWESCEIEDDSVACCTIITTSPNALMAQLGNRLPVILAPKTFDWWMTGSTDAVRPVTCGLSIRRTRGLSDQPTSQQSKKRGAKIVTSGGTGKPVEGPKTALSGKISLAVTAYTVVAPSTMV